MNRKYNLKLDLQFRCNNSTMKFNQFDNNTSDFFIKISNGGKSFDVEKAIVVLAVIKPSGKVSSQFVEIENGLVYADLKPNMRDEIGTYTAQAMLILEDERVVTDVISYEVEEGKIFSLLNDTVETSEEFTLLTDMLSRLSTIEISEEQRVINEAERILSEENRKIEEAKRVEAELIRQHEEADRSKYDAIRESNENIRKQNESIRLANETNRIDEEAKRVEEEAKRVEAEQLRKDNYNFMTEDEERRRLEANAHKEAEILRVQAETNRVNEEAKRRTTEQARVSAENTRVSNENTRKANEVTRQTNETQRVEAETQRQNRYNSFIADAEANTSNFENYTNTAKVKEEERKSNELDRKSQETKRVSNEVERISNENTRKANEKAREKNEASRQNTFTNKVNEVDKKIIEINTTKDNFVSSINTKVDTKISEIDNVKDNFVSNINTKVDTKISEIEVAKSDMTNTVSNKVNEVENRFNALTSKQQQDAEVIDARDGETSLKARLDRDVEKANKELDKIKKLEESTVSTVETESDFTTVEATSNGYFEDVKLEGKTLVNIVNDVKGSTKQTIVADGSNKNISYKTSSALQIGKEYTFIVYISKNTLNGNGYMYLANSYTTTPQIEIPTNSIGLVTRKITISNEHFDRGTQQFAISKNMTGGEIDIDYYMILEGDHTQNPPNGYIEGLKSVGDGVDEVSVESATSGNMIDLSDIIEGSYISPSSGKISVKENSFYCNTLIPISPNMNIVFRTTTDAKQVGIFLYYDKDKQFISGQELVNNNYLTIPQNTKYLRLSFYNRLHIKECLYVGLGDKPVLIDYQSDKKRLLYYNEETQTWEKPILREWDSIEKHANGKYYYHQRSGEVVLNGSEDWIIDNNNTRFGLYNINAITGNVNVNVEQISDKFSVYDRYGEKIGSFGVGVGFVRIQNNFGFTTANEFKQWLQANNVTVVYQLAEEKVYECTNIDLITYANETNYIVESGVLSPKTTLKVHNNISNVVSLLQKKVSLLESDITSYMITQNRLMLASRYNADTVSFKVDVATLRNSFEYDNDLYELILNNILVGKDNYNREYIENLIIFYWMDFVISDEMHSTLFEIIEEQHNPKVIEEETPLI